VFYAVLDLSKLIQNTLLYGDLALRFPTFIHRQYDGKKTTQQLIKWCFDFVTKANITDGTSAEQTLHLVSEYSNCSEVITPNCSHMQFIYYSIREDKGSKGIL